jgi:hypothetical protein
MSLIRAEGEKSGNAATFPERLKMKPHEVSTEVSNY